MGDACKKLKVAVWHCNGTLWSDPRGFLKTYTDRDMIFNMKTHESPERGLPTITSYRWESAHRKCRQRSMLVTCGLESALFMAVCYFLPDMSSYACHVTTKGHNPYETLHADITEFSTEGDVLLLGNFNARTSNKQVGLLDFEDDYVSVPEL